MKRLKLYVFLTLFLSLFLGRAQELPPIENFFPYQYNAGNQNWSISQSSDKRIYVANNSGLLEYNGAFWRLYPSPNETIMRSVKVIEDVIYTGAYMDFGYWKKNRFGVMEYTSLSQKLNLELLNDEEFWKIIEIERWVVFQSLNRIYIYDRDQEEVSIIEPDGLINKMFVIGETIYFQKLNEGIYKISNGAVLLFIDDPRISTNEVINLFSDGDHTILLTRDNGFLRVKNGVLEEWGSHNQVLSDLSIYDAERLKNKNFALGTISKGLIYFNQAEGIIHEINQSQGIQNNTILSVFEDSDGNIWTGLDNGISYINITAPVIFYNDNNGVIGSVYASAIFDNAIYLGTNQGLFYQPLDNPQQPFKLIPNSQGQVWSLEVFYGELFCGHHRGTFIVKNNTFQKINNTEGTWSIQLLDNQPNELIQGNYDGLYILHKPTGSWQVKNKIEKFNTSSRSFAVLDNTIIVNHEYKGVYQLNVSENFSAVSDVQLDSILKGKNSSVAKFNGDILYGYSKGILTFDPLKKTFSRDTVLSKIYSEENYVSGRIIPNSGGDVFWAFTRDNIVAVSSGNLTNTPTIEFIPLNQEARRDVVEYENIIQVPGEDTYLLGTSFGYIKFDSRIYSIDNFYVSIGTILSSKSNDADISGSFVDKSGFGEFENDQNNLTIDFYTPTYFRYLKPSYQFQLQGIYNNWSKWDSETTVSFKNLPPGNYTFNVRAKLGEKLSANVASYTFRISKPWFASPLMIAIYLIVAFLTFILTHYASRSYYHRQQEQLVAQNKKDLDLARLQKEKEINQIKSDQLRSDLRSKSNELAASILSIAKKNDLLSDIKRQLSETEDHTSISSVINVIDQNLSNDENWQLFMEAFESTDNEFFKNLNQQHSDLSPNDLKLCAYLRLNLSSKEIAQLLSISPKSVEIKRYRLRKKLNLESNQNLINYILSI